MVTAIYSLSQVHGAELWLLFWLVSLVAYLILCFVRLDLIAKHRIK